LHCDDLAAKTKPKDVLKALEKFAQGGNALDQAYEHSMQRIQCQPKEHTELARKVLICITFGARPLKLGELRHAIAVDEGTEELDPEYDLDDPDVLISACAGLVTIDSERKTIRLVHYTTQSFLESLQDGFLSGSHHFLASCCLNYLLLDVFAEGHVRDERWKDSNSVEYGRRAQQYPFLAYSARFWTQHMALEHTHTSLMLRAFTFLDNFGHVASAFQALEHGVSFEHGWSPIQLLAAMGSDQMLEDYINRGYQADGMQNDRVECQDCKQLTSKHLNELKGSQLPWKEAITSLKNDCGQTPLVHAARSGHSSTVALLLDFNQALINESDYRGQAPLFWAVRYRQESIALQLLGEPDIVGPWYQDLHLRDCLPEAASQGYEAVVDRLLELAVDARTSKIDATTMPTFLVQREVAGKALEEAAFRGHLPIVKKLWRYSCDGQLHLPDAAGERALIKAARYGKFDVVQYLGDQENIQLDFLDDNGMSVLHHACRGGNVLVLAYIFRNFQAIAVDLSDEKGRTALSYAAGNNRLEAAQILACEKNANVDLPDKKGITPIMYAASSRRCDILKLLAPLVSDINCTDASGKTVVHRLVRNYYRLGLFTEDEEELRSSLVCLVKHGASLNARDETGRTAYEQLCDQEAKISQALRDNPRERQYQMERLKQVEEIMERMHCNPTVS
jgi:ankyrin repeat protein